MTAILCPDCGHKASAIHDDAGCHHSEPNRAISAFSGRVVDTLERCPCRTTAAELYALEADRLAQMYQREVENAEASRAEVERLTAELTVAGKALDEIAETEARFTREPLNRAMDCIERALAARASGVEPGENSV